MRPVATTSTDPLEIAERIERAALARARHGIEIERYAAAQHLLVSPTGAARGFMDDLLAEHGLSRTIALTVPSFLWALTVIADGDLVGTLPRTLVRVHGERFGVAAIEPPLPFGADPRPRDRDAGRDDRRGCRVAHGADSAGSAGGAPRAAPRRTRRQTLAGDGYVRHLARTSVPGAESSDQSGGTNMNRRGFVRNSLAAAVGASLPLKGALGAILSASKAVDADINAVTGDGASVTLKRAAVQELGESLRGNLILPGHAVYDDARRVLNASISKFPALIVQPRGVADIRNTVKFARSENLLVAVKCGGHSHSGKSTCDGGLMIDLSLMRGVRVDERERIAYVSGGSLLGDMDNETMQFGLVTSAGTVSHTGVAGSTLGGGFGRVARRYGLSLDNVRAVDIVTADGELRARERRREPRAPLGRARRRRQLRHRDESRVRAAPDAARGRRRQHRVPVQQGAPTARLLRRVRGERARRAVPVHGPAEQPGRARGLVQCLLQRPGARGRARVREGARRRRHAAARHAAHDRLRRAAALGRRRRSARRRLVHEVRVLGGTEA